MSTTNFYNADVEFKLQEKKKLKKWIETVLRTELKTFEQIDYVFCSDNYLLKINRAYLKHDYYTDIITFDLSESKKIKAEIYISIERVRDNAIKHQQLYKNELLRVLVHGVLHLCGYSDKSKTEGQLMRSKEDEYILLYYKT
jgi:rRNA maturation RNase YbeY